MIGSQYFKDRIFDISHKGEFDRLALELFRYQYQHNSVYHSYINHLGIDISAISEVDQIPFLPISFFKSHRVISGGKEEEVVFSSSGTGGQQSLHYVADAALYNRTFTACFEAVYDSPEDWCILALLPSYMEREGSSLILMVDELIKRSGHPQSGFFLKDHGKLMDIIRTNEASGARTLLFGVTFALLDLAEGRKEQWNHTTIVETGGMKGRRKEMIRAEVHEMLKSSFGCGAIHSEYGMTELLSQAYSSGSGRFQTPPWMKVMIREVDDPFTKARLQKTGGINIIDLANIDSCAFIETQDLGRSYADGSFEVLGRFDNSDIRGCNLLVV